MVALNSLHSHHSLESTFSCEAIVAYVMPQALIGRPEFGQILWQEISIS
jgi:hypothetical protein